MEYSIVLDPLAKTVLTLKLFRNVTNMGTLKTKLISGELDCSLIKPSLIYDPFQIVVAANKAVLRIKTITKNVYTEIIFNLSPSKKITQSLETFGVDESDTDVVVAVLKSIENDDEETHQKTFEEISGDLVSIKEITNIRDLNKIRKVYNILDKETATIDILDSIVSRIVIKE